MNWVEHKILTPPTDEEMALMQPEELLSLHAIYHEAIENAERDPYRYGFKLPHWEKAEEQLAVLDELLALGGNRSGKTRFGAYAVVRAAVENPNAEIFCFAQTAEVSKRQQQKAVWEALPVEMRAKMTTANTYISYSAKNGFTDDSLILPNGSQIIFKTYAAYLNNPTILEGAELGAKTVNWINIGCWLDEYLMGEDMVNTIRFRLVTRGAKLILTFTPIDGYTEVVKQYLTGAKTIESRQAELLNGETVPYVQLSRDICGSVHYFHSQDNPFGGYEGLVKKLAGKSREDILIRAYGVPVKSQATKFPKFNSAVNIVEPSQIPTKGTRYFCIDPAGAKQWFMVHAIVDESETIWIYREYPTVEAGEWAEWRSGKWQPGPASKGTGLGVADYAEIIKQSEAADENGKEKEEIFERLIDPRLGAAVYHGSSIIEDLEDQGITCLPAPGDKIEEGLQALISKMAWDTSKPLDSVNRPHFYISSDCGNLIQALAEYTGEGGLKEAWKDPIDCLRYLAIAEISHVTDQSFKTTFQGSGGY
jgi:Terminase large subunit, T4likevirus-type, N-terminal